MSLGTRIKSARLAKKLTQRQLGELVKCTGSAIGNYEKGVSSPNEDILIRLMSVLEVDANYLYADYMADIRGVYFLSPANSGIIRTAARDCAWVNRIGHRKMTEKSRRLDTGSFFNKKSPRRIWRGLLINIKLLADLWEGA